LSRVRGLAVVLGRIDVVRALGRAGVRSLVVGDRDDPIRHSRFVTGVIAEDELWARRAEGLPLLYDSDAALAFVASNRDRLAERHRFVLPRRELLDDLLDKRRFQALAERLGLPVPRSATVGGADAAAAHDLRFPVVIKASPQRDGRWEAAGLPGKVLRADDPAGLRDALARLEAAGIEAVAQELVPGGEDRVESYHVYVDDDGEVAAEFTGRKIRTTPREFGATTALETTDAPDVVAAGRDVVERLGFTGVAKLDLKRDPDGRLHLLELNPRFTLWARAGAVAGVNLPAIVYADLSGAARPPAARARPGVRWIWARADAAAAREQGISFPAWLAWALRVETNASFALSDPAPYVVRRLRRAPRR
jgi:predicted ATP-grasp superfamily ATP-dependent carboligase